MKIAIIMTKIFDFQKKVKKRNCRKKRFQKIWYRSKIIKNKSKVKKGCSIS